ncbi:MAG: hypothetical protein ACTHK7_21550 [Aureliella sp.]
MIRFPIVACAILALAAPALAFDAPGTLKSIDFEKGVVSVLAGGQERTLRIAEDCRALDRGGKELPGGLKSAELKPGAEVIVTVEREGGQPVLYAMRLRPVQERDADPRALQAGKPATGLKPLTEMTADEKYKGEDGGLYGGGHNEPPPSLAAEAARQTAKIVPLDRQGKPTPDGKIGLISISMSNATQEFSAFKRLADADTEKSSRVTIVDCAQGGQTMAAWSSPDAKAWDEAARRLKAAEVAPEQVQVAWIKLANARPQGELSEHGKRLYDDTVSVLRLAKKKFPNLQIVFLSSRIYGGYANTPLNPEPYAYEGAFVVRWLIRDQSGGDAALNYDGQGGPAQAPLLLWGPYLWADGTTPRKSDGLIWQRSDLAADGTHPSPSGQKKVAELLLKFFKTDTNAKKWFVATRE